jgi:uncharacterized membrane protein YeaQ/YmgE (transglycosylase-associated protein family)
VDIILWIVFGLIVGVIAKFVMPGRDPGGFIMTVVLGIVGALWGGGWVAPSTSIAPGNPPASSWP